MSELAEFALRFVNPSRTGYVFTVGAERGLALAFDDLFESGVDLHRELSDLLRLGALFERSHASPGIGRCIINWMAKDHRILAALGITSGRHAAALRRRFLKIGGPSAPLAAPKYGVTTPRGAVKARDFLTPGREIRRASKASQSSRMVVLAVNRANRARPGRPRGSLKA